MQQVRPKGLRVITGGDPRGRATPVRKVAIANRAISHTFRLSLATHLLEDRYDIRTAQDSPGHEDVKTTMVYTHVLNRGGKGVRSPVDEL